MALARAPLVMAMPPLAAMALARAPLVMAMPPLAAVKLLCGRLSNAQRFGSDSCVCCRVASFAPCTNDAVFRMTSGTPSPRRGLLPEIGSRLPVPFDATRRLSVFFYTSSRRTHERKVLVRGVGQPLPRIARRANWNSRAWGKDLGCLCDLIQPPGTRTPRSWNCRCSARLPKAAHQSPPTPRD